MRLIRLAYIQILPILFFTALFAACGNGNQTKDENIADSSKSLTGAEPNKGSKKQILFFGTSLTAGLGVDPEQAFPAQIQKKIDSLHLPYTVINAGLSGETSADGKNRIDWLLRQPVDIFVLELGANDGLRGLSVKATAANLQAIIDKVKLKYPSAKLVLAGMQMPPSMGENFTVPFRELFPALAKKNKMVLVPFLLNGVGGHPELMQQDGIHPNPQGHEVLAANVWTQLQSQL